MIVEDHPETAGMLRILSDPWPEIGPQLLIADVHPDGRMVFNETLSVRSVLTDTRLTPADRFDVYRLMRDHAVALWIEARQQ